MKLLVAIAVVGFALILWRLIRMSEALTRLTTEVSENTSVIQSAITLLGNLSQIIRDNAGDPAALGALADQLDTQSNSLAQAITANTPAAPTPGPDTQAG